MKYTRDPKNVQPVVDGEVLVSFEKDPKIGLDGHFGDEWATLGILNKGSKVALNRTIEKNKINGWGYGVVATSTSPGDLTAEAEVLENNEMTERIAWPSRAKDDGITIDGEASILYHDEVVAQPHVAMVEKRQDGKMKIRATRYPAIATMEDLGFQEEPEGKTVAFDFESGVNKDAFDEIVVGYDNSKNLSDKIVRFASSANAGSTDSPNPTPTAKTVTFPDGVTGGNWDLTINGTAVNDLAFDATASIVQEAITTAGITGVAVSGAPGAYSIAGATSVTADGSGLTGGASTTITVA
ncbi:hypothetical protein WG936_08205 [Corynebacterium sp. H127]|uniref:hypothetical protein n=1 Tax=Corynebacterium sp. H127 TaxID=3133418 RepID=UPI0030B4F354